MFMFWSIAYSILLDIPCLKKYIILIQIKDHIGDSAIF